MSDKFTAKNYPTNAPKRITLLGDKTKRPEPAQHIIEFPGGAIEVSRTSTGDYWAHITVNRGEHGSLWDGFRSHQGAIIDSRIDQFNDIQPIPGAETASQIAVLIHATFDEKQARR